MSATGADTTVEGLRIETLERDLADARRDTRDLEQKLARAEHNVQAYQSLGDYYKGQAYARDAQVGKLWAALDRASDVIVDAMKHHAAELDRAARPRLEVIE